VKALGHALEVGSRSHISRFLMMLVILLPNGVNPVSASEYLSIKFSKKNQIRTGMHWIQHQRDLILVPSDALENRSGGSHSKSRDSFSIKEYPYSTIGKLLFTRENGDIATCTAAFAGGSDLIITAAHCVMDSTGNWNSDFLFIRSYGSEQKDVYAIQCVAAPAEWGQLTDSSVYSYDYAFLRTNRRSKSGSMGITNGKPPEKLLLVGYSNDYFGGSKLQQLNVEAWTSEEGKIGLLNNIFGSGSSGTPWLGLSTVYSVTSHFQNDDQGVMWGPKLTYSTMQLISYSLNGCENP
jgi:hypothetical protein